MSEKLREAMKSLVRTAQLLQQNAEGCAVNHHGLDFQEQGLPGWLRDTQKSIDAAYAALAEPAAAPSDFERAFTDACDEIGCAHDNEALLEAIASLKKSAVTPHERWQPIETAPRDGTRIDLLFRGNMRFTDCAWSEGAWWATEADEPSVCLSHGTSQPTHWMLIPAFPRADCGGGK